MQYLFSCLLVVLKRRHAIFMSLRWMNAAASSWERPSQAAWHIYRVARIWVDLWFSGSLVMLIRWGRLFYFRVFLQQASQWIFICLPCSASSFPFTFSWVISSTIKNKRKLRVSYRPSHRFHVYLHTRTYSAQDVIRPTCMKSSSDAVDGKWETHDSMHWARI